jgi:hypothetical protein
LTPSGRSTDPQPDDPQTQFRDEFRHLRGTELESPMWQWRQIATAFWLMMEHRAGALQDDALSMGLEPNDLYEPAGQPEDLVREFAERTPHLELTELREADPYDLAVGVVRMLAPSQNL